MSLEVTAPNASPFLASSPDTIPGAPALLGVPYDGTTSFRPGTRFGPDAIRRVSDGLETYSPTLDADLGDHPFTDYGNLVIPHGCPEPVARLAGDAVKAVMETGAIPFILGGEHSVTPGAVRAVLDRHPDLLLIQLDAHADLREEFNGSKWSHASAMRRCLDRLAPDRLLQVGIRSGTREEFSEMKKENRHVSPSGWALAEALERIGEAPIYLTLDLDILDPSLLPGTGTPEPGGIDWPTLAGLLEVIPWKNVVACDVMELSPELDPSGCSSVLAAKAVREILLHLGKSSGPDRTPSSQI